MASQQSIIDFILDQISEAGSVSAKKMFGEYGIYCNNKIVAFVCDDQLFLKPTAAAKKFIGDYSESCPYPGAKPYLLISEEKWDDREWLVQLFRISAEQLPITSKKSPRAHGSKKN